MGEDACFEGDPQRSVGGEGQSVWFGPRPEAGQLDELAVPVEADD